MQPTAHGGNAANSLQRMVSIVPVKGQSSKTEWLKSALRRSVGLLSLIQSLYISMYRLWRQTRNYTD